MAFRLRWPTEFGAITQQFGARPEVYSRFGLPGHEGLDFRAPNGSKVFACANGTVSQVSLDGNTNRTKFPYGNQVRIVHRTDEGEFTTVYAHLQEADVRVGDVITAGQLIGLADETGNVEGAHLHLTLKKRGATARGETGYPNDIVDPSPFLDPFQADVEHPTSQLDDMHFLKDITIPDNTLVAAGTAFTKTWRIRNNGTTSWGADYALAFFKDRQMGAPDSVALPPAQPGEIVEVSVNLVAPNSPGLQRSTWRARRPDGEPFGDVLFALIKVPASDADLPLNVVIDLSHHNTVTNLQATKDDGVVGIIHKATQGLHFVDDQYAPRRDEARRLGLLWGAYHFGEGGDPIGQVEHFLKTVQPDEQTLLALDLEHNPFGPSMSLAEAEQFAEHLHAQVGRWPLLYTGSWYIRQFLNHDDTTSLDRCPLWVASYQDAPAFPNQWSTWTFWQYTNGVNGPQPRQVAGILRCDRNMFNGSLIELQGLWSA